MFLFTGVHSACAQGSAFTYQGRLNDNGAPASGNYDFRFRIAADALGNTFIDGPVLSNAIPVAGGLFTMTLDFGAGIFTGSNYWLQVEVKTNGAAGYTTLAPLQALTPTPYAIFANTASNLSGTLASAQLSGALPSAQLSGSYSSAVSFTNAANNFSGAYAGNGGGLTNVNAATLGAFGADQLWKTAGNSNTVAGVSFLGTTDNQPLELRANRMRVWRLEPDQRPNGGAGNLIGGFTNNLIEQPGSGGDVIVGGGFDAGVNIIHSNSSGVFIGAGSANQAGPNINDAVIGGGYGNTILSYDSVIGGGRHNTIQPGAFWSSIGGGYGNQVGGYYGTIPGGYNNTAVGRYATVPGGYANAAYGNFSFAAGQQAYANHDGAFVWADSQPVTFGSTATNQFLIRASGGVGIGTTSPGYPLTVQADGVDDISWQNSSFELGRLGYSGANAGWLGLKSSGTFNVQVKASGPTYFNGGNVGIGTASPQAALHVRGADGAQFTLQNSADNSSWYFSDDLNDNLVFQPNTGVGAYIDRAGNYHNNSDARLKRDITALGGVLARVLQLRPVSYHFRSAPGEGPLTLGLIAQEVEPLFPEVVGEHAGTKSLAYTELVPVTIRAIQELNEKVASENARLREELQRRDADTTELEQRLERLERLANEKSGGAK